MSGLLRELVLGVSAAAIFGGVAMTFVQGGALKEIIRLAAGLMVMLALLRPLSNLRLPSLSRWYHEQTAPITRTVERAAEKNNELALSTSSAGMARYLQDKAEKLGVNCSIFIHMTRDSENIMVIEGATVTYREATIEQLDQLADMIETECGIPREIQEYVER